MDENRGLPIEQLQHQHLVKAGLSPSEASFFHEQLQSILSSSRSFTTTWQHISQELLKPDHPFPFHQLMYYSKYCDWDSDLNGPPLGWIPTLEFARQTNLGRLLERKGRAFLGKRYRSPTESLPEFQCWSVEHPESVVFHRQTWCFLDSSNKAGPGGVWVPGAHLNVAECCLAAKGIKSDSSIAIVHRNEGEDDLALGKIALSELRANVSRVANALEALGFKKGDAIAIDMPMNVDAVAAYLAIILAGCVVVSIPDSFVAHEIAVRVRLSQAKAVFAQNVIRGGGKRLPLYSRVIEARTPLAIVIPADGKASSLRFRVGDMLWNEFVAHADQVSRPDEYKAVVQSMDSYTNILFSSGTTGEPKTIPWTHHTPRRCAAAAWAHLDVGRGDVICW